MTTKLFPGDTVLVKHPIFTDGKWKKGQILKVNDVYEIRLSNDIKTLVINKTNIVYDINVIKVDSNFKMGCANCKHWNKLGNDEPCYECLRGHNHYYWKPCDSLKNKDKLIGNDIKTFSIDEGPFYPNPKFDIKLLDLPTHSDYIDALRYSAKLMAYFNKKENKNMKKQQKRRNRNILVVKDFNTAIEFDEIKFNGPATIIKWKQTFTQAINDKKADKTVTVTKEPDKFDKTTGFLLAVLKEVLDNKSYGNILEKIDEIKKSDELSVEEDRDSKYVHHIPKGTIALLNEAAEAMNNAFHIGSRVKYIHGKLVYRVVDCAYIPTKHEMYYTLSAYQNDILSGHETPKVYNVAHHRLKQVKRR